MFEKTSKSVHTSTSGTKKYTTTTITTKDKDGNSFSKSHTSKSLSGFGVLKLVFIAILASTLMRLLTNSNQEISFTGFLEMLSTVPHVEYVEMLHVSDLYITTDWGLFNFVREFLNLFVGSWQMLIYLTSGAIQSIYYIIYFLRFLFIG